MSGPVQPLKTKLTTLFGNRSPIISAPMYGAAGTAMTIATHRAGGLGVLPVGWDDISTMENHIKHIRSELNIPDGAPMPVGIGYIVCMLDATGGIDDVRLSVALKYKPAAIMLAFTEYMEKWANKFHELQAQSEHKAKLIITVNSLDEARRAVYNYKADVIVVQGCEAGGHSRNTAPPLFTFLQAVLDIIPPKDRPVIAAAGGVFTGPQIAGLLTLGADGVIIGSRFLVSPECLFSDLAKEVILESGFNATVYNNIADDIESSWRPPFPKAIGGRTIANQYVKDHEAGLNVIERLRLYHEGGRTPGEKSRLLIWAGIGIGHLKKIESVESIMHQLQDGCIETLRNAQQKFSLPARSKL
jgi:nitronate monooxygenase